LERFWRSPNPYTRYQGSEDMTHMMGNDVNGNMDYPVFNENPPVKMDVSIFNTEYRVLQRMKRINAGFPEAKQCSYQSVMRELLTAANGVIAYDFSLEILLSHVKESCKGPDSSMIPMTIIAWKNLSGRMFCSVERIFLKWDNSLPLEDNLLANAYMEQSAQVVSKLSQEHCNPLGAIGKGDYRTTLRKVFMEQFGYTLI
jgi:hypothetical protein